MTAARAFDLAIVGAGILGLAHALAAQRLGLRVVVIDRDAKASGASIRNFGFVTVSGQAPGTMWHRALRTRDVWLQVAQAAQIEVLHRGALIAARTLSALSVLNAFHRTEMGEGCELLSAAELTKRQPQLEAQHFEGALWSPHEIRVESTDAIPKLAAYLASLGVEFRRDTVARMVAPPVIETSSGPIHALKAIVCPGDDLVTLFPDRIGAHNVSRCKLHMMRLADPGFRLVGTVMSDLSLIRYEGFAALPEAAALRELLEHREKPAIENGVHLIVVQSADGSLIVGDSHHYAAAPDPFNDDAVDEIILGAYRNVFVKARPQVLARWTGTYATANQPLVVDAPTADIRLVLNTGGNGASTSFAVAEEVIAELFGATIENVRRTA